MLHCRGSFTGIFGGMHLQRMQVASTDRTCFPHCIAIMMHAQGLNRSCLFSTPARRASLRCHASGGLPFQAFNQFKVKPDKCEDFEEIWRKRESRLKETPGFIRFALLRGDEAGDYISQSTWESRDAFKAWTSSSQFAKAHGAKQGEEHKPAAQEKRQGMADLLEGPPKPKWYQAVTVTE